MESLLESFEGEELDEESECPGDCVVVGVSVEEQEDPVQAQGLSQEEGKPVTRRVRFQV